MRLFFLFLIASQSWITYAKPLTMAFTDRAPYHYVEDNPQKPKGIMAKILHKVLKDSQIKVTFLVLNANQIMSRAKKKAPFCSFTWFKNPEREKFAHFTLPLWHDQPFVLVANKNKVSQLHKFKTLKDFATQSEMSLGTRDTISYGSYVDSHIFAKSSKLEIKRVANSQVNMVRMLDRGRFDLMVLSPEEMPSLFKEASVNQDN